MFFIRSAFWLALLIAILPSDPKEQARLQETASAAVHHTMTFCDRNAAICREAATHWAHFKEKAAVGARMAGDLVSEHMSRTGSPQPPAGSVRFEPRPAPLPTFDTLESADRKPAWQPRQRAGL